MAASDARAVPIRNAAFRATYPILDADGDLVTGAATLDSERSIDGGTFADCTNEATEIATGSGMYFLDLTAAEMNGDTVAVITKTSTAGAKTTPLVFYTAARSINDLAFPTTSGRSISVSGAGVVQADVALWATAAVNALIGGRVDANAQVVGDKSGYGVGAGGITAGSFSAGAIDAAAIATDALTAAKFAADCITAAKIASGAIDADAIAADAITSAKIAADAIGASELAADAATEIRDAIFAKVVEAQGSYTLQQVCSILLAVLAGVTSNNGATLKSPDGVSTRVAATIDANNNRTAMALTPSA